MAGGVACLVVSGSHILLGELVPKSIAIRIADRSALWSARPLRFFHRLLFMENVFDLGELTVRDAMRQRAQVRTLDARRPWAEHLPTIQTAHFTRYPLITTNPLGKPVLMVLRSPDRVDDDGTPERGRLLFVLLTPAGQPRVHQRLQSILATLLHESDYVKERLMTATSAEEVVEVIRTGEQAALD